MPLLSRAADHLYWLGRHLERLEYTTRLIEEHTNLLVDLPVQVESDWSILLAMVGAPHLVPTTGTLGEGAVIDLVLEASSNPGSVATTLAAARENLRVTRQLVPLAAWERLNLLHLELSTARRDGRLAQRSQRLAFCQSARAACQQVAGIIELGMERSHGYQLYHLGRALERADMTVLILDARVSAILSATGACGPREPADRSPFEDVRWLGLLRSTDSLEAYHRCTATPVEAASVVRFLLEEDRSPRCVGWCLVQIEQALGSLPGRRLPPTACANARRVVAGGIPLPLSREAFHLHVDSIQLALDALHEAVNDAYFVAGQSVLEGAGSR